jgi:cyanate permease
MTWVGGTASMGHIMSNFQVDSMASASFISGAVTFAKIIGTFLAAYIALKIGIKVAFFASSILVAIGILTPLASSYDVLLISRFLMGLGGALMIVYFNPIVMKLFPVEDRPVINGFNAVAFNVGTAIILWSMSAINSITGSWENSLILFSVASLLLALLWIFVEYETKQTNNTNSVKITTNKYSYLDGIKDKFNWAYALCYSGLLAFYICLFTFYPKAGIVASKWVIGFGIIGTIAGMIYSKYVPKRLPVIRWSGLLQTITIIGLSFSNNEILQTASAIVLGFVIFFPITALISIPHELPQMTTDKITVVFSLFWSISYLIATLVLWLFGFVVDMYSGNYTQAFVLISIVSTSFFIGSFFLPEPKK